MDDLKARTFQSEWPTAPAGIPPVKPGKLGFFRELPALIIIAFGLALLMKTFLIQAFFIPSGSMEPTLHGCDRCKGDRVLVNKLVYRFREPRRGEIIVFIAKKGDQNKSLVQKIKGVLFEGIGVTTPEETDFIKRVIGLPGDMIEVTGAGVFITPPRGKRSKLTEPYIFDKSDQGPSQESFKVPSDRLFVMGDNRGNSSDSRSALGPIKRDDVIGKAFVKIWPVGRWGILGVPDYGTKGRASGGVPIAPIAVPLVALASAPWMIRRMKNR